MKRSGFLLGLLSTGGQVLLLRTLVSTFNGDEVLIGIALFGWLVAVALGAFWGGRKAGVSDKLLFVIGAASLPLIIILLRLSPVLLTDHVGEVIPFIQAALVSIIVMVPTGLVSGWLFSALAQKEGFNPVGSIGTVYLFEGIGAFVVGIIISLTAGTVVSTLGIALILTVLVIFASLGRSNKYYYFTATITAAVLVVIIVWAATVVDRKVDGRIFKGYQLAASFDTPYSHQSILKRDESTILMTDNSIEAISPDREMVENILIPPLIYKPDASSVIYIGRAEFGVAQMAESLGLGLFVIDPRSQLDASLESILDFKSGIVCFIDDPVRFFSGNATIGPFDIIIVNIGDPGSYHNSRLLTGKFLALAGKALKPDGMIYIPTGYDTDRYISNEAAGPLSIMGNTLRSIYVNVASWPGNMTLFFASPELEFELTPDEMMERLKSLNIKTEYIHPDYLYDRLNFMKIERLETALKSSPSINTIKRPVLPHHQILYRSMIDSTDRKLMNLVLTRPFWIIIIPLLIFLFLLLSILRNRRTNQFAMFLFFIAGLVSLSFELTAFYLYQATAGSLYREMAILIGTFMLGLALGTYYSLKGEGYQPLEFPALIMLLVTGFIFISSWQAIGSRLALPYYSLFLFVTALATGTLFIGATNRYYADNWISNRGSGYGWELLGSSAGALLTTTFILPIIGLTWLLWSMVILVGFTLIGAILTARG